MHDGHTHADAPRNSTVQTEDADEDDNVTPGILSTDLGLCTGGVATTTCVLFSGAKACENRGSKNRAAKK